MSIYLKACQRCRGSLFLESDDQMGTEWVCLQCGWRSERLESQDNYRASGNQSEEEIPAITNRGGCDARRSVCLLHNRHR
jgi:hypothetical protein